MKASTIRKIIRWIHILFSIPIIGFIYGPVSKIQEATFMVRAVFFPTIVVSGFLVVEGTYHKKMDSKTFCEKGKIGNHKFSYSLLIQKNLEPIMFFRAYSSGNAMRRIAK